ncbi:hypothetical protein SAMN06272735_9210 [Streptomyces sp. TLI_55]|uniref:hypothetical protein n=1 Tax=Streptomyces sp. TLI_55 TaxID=1938861 RepID=UPI000BC41675|nr:hypothetical protein [Streptomyces sp. TLI_55]SNX88714.1 hypothetical protein SAMN06272735_9210 [Streptomyces sp. TLI_55]
MNTAKDYGDCQIYLRGGNRESVTALVAATLGASVDDHYTIRTGRMVFEIRDNPDDGLAADFIGWPFTIEAQADDSAPVLVEAVAHVLTAFWNRGLDAVAACDFEDELPDLGGRPRYR